MEKRHDSESTHVENPDVQHGGKDHGLDVAAILDEKHSHSTSTTDQASNSVATAGTGTPQYESKEVRRLIRKIDFRLLPCLAAIYSFALIDRVNLPNARIAGMDEDLGLSVGSRYSLVSMIFFIPYVICQFPANIVIRKIGAMLWLPSLVVAWGIVSVGIGFTTKWDQLLGCRILLGVLEAGEFSDEMTIECRSKATLTLPFQATIPAASSC